MHFDWARIIGIYRMFVWVEQHIILAHAPPKPTLAEGTLRRILL